MRISTIGYVGKQGVKNIWRNKMFSLASVATMSACIFLFGLFFSILVNFQYIIRTAEEGVAITVFFDEDATEEQKQQIGEQLRAHEGVADVVYVSAEEAWDEFQKEYFGDNPELAEGFKDDNPLASSDNYEVYMQTMEDDGQNLMARSRSLSETQNSLVKFARDWTAYVKSISRMWWRIRFPASTRWWRLYPLRSLSSCLVCRSS